EGLVPDKPAPISGLLETFSYDLSGSLKGEPAKNIKGPITISVKDGELKGANIAGDVLRELVSLPFIGEELFGERGKKALEGDTTPLESLSGTFNMANGVITTDDLNINSLIFELRGKGTLTTDAEVNMNTALLFAADFSANMADKARELKAILNEQGRLEVP